ncbi:MAG: TPM domain-containing protein, partial [Rhodoferax sp.]|nr:TPM domain-containing protein [Rhodoferax sp.]
MPLLMPLLLLVLLVLQPFTALAQEAVPALKGHVTDLTATLSAAQQAQLEQRLGAFEASKGTQLAVLMIPSTQPEAIEQYALRVAEQWKLGRKQVDDGAILLIAKNDRALRIEVGYGLEGALSDIVSKRIIEEHIRPRFQQGDFFGGIEAGLAQMMRVIDGEPLPSPRQQTGQAGQARQAGTRFEELRSMAPVLFIGVLAVGGVIARLLGKLPGALVTGGLVALIAWFVMGAVLVSLLAGLLAMVLTLLGVGRVLQGVG